MGKIEDVNKMGQEGMSEAEIVSALRQKGVSESDAYDLISQSQIKDAVSSEEAELDAPSPGGAVDYNAPQIQQYDEMQQYGGVQEQAPQEYSAQPQQQYSASPEQYSQSQGNVEQGYPSYSTSEQYQPYQEAISSDVITEISEQVVSEKLAGVEEKLTKILNFKTVSEAKISALDERLKRIEQILDRLQLSILQKVGEYVNDVKDLKREVVETQISFTKLSGGKHHKPHTHHASHSEHANHEHAHHSPEHHTHSVHQPAHHGAHNPEHHTHHVEHHKNHPHAPHHVEHHTKNVKKHSSHSKKELDLRKKYP